MRETERERDREKDREGERERKRKSPRHDQCEHVTCVFRAVYIHLQ